jgi:nucleoid-associated protein YgaU
MGLFDFLKDVGKNIAGGPSADEILANLKQALGEHAESVEVWFEDGTVLLGGQVDSEATRQKIILLAGNVKGVEKVNDDKLTVGPAEVEEPAFTFYTIKSGDSLSKIARSFYGDASKWPALFEANKEVIENPDLIYPGQQIRVPANPEN